MSLDVIFALVDPRQTIGLVLAGTAFGAFVFGQLPRGMSGYIGYLMAGTGFTYFVFLVALRAVDNPLVAERTIGTGILWLVFSFGTAVGIELRSRAVR